MKILRVFSWLLLVAAMPVLSQPVQVSESEFEVLAAEMPRTIEDFNRFPGGDIASPVALRNSQFTGAPSIGAPWCLSSPCLTINLINQRLAEQEASAAAVSDTAPAQSAPADPAASADADPANAWLQAVRQ